MKRNTKKIRVISVASLLFLNCGVAAAESISTEPPGPEKGSRESWALAGFVEWIERLSQTPGTAQKGGTPTGAGKRSGDVHGPGDTWYGIGYENRMKLRAHDQGLGGGRGEPDNDSVGSSSGNGAASGAGGSGSGGGGSGGAGGSGGGGSGGGSGGGGR